MNRTRLITALLLSATFACRDHKTGEGEDPPRLSEQEWEEKKRTELGKRTHDQLVSKQIELERDLARARAKVAPEGSRVLSAEEATEYDALRALGASKDLKGRLETGDKAVTTLAGRERGDLIRDVAEAAGYKPKVLGKLADQDGVTFELGAEVEKDGKKTRPVTVKTQDGKTAPLDEYAKANWADFEASLAAGSTGGQQQQQEKRPPVVTGGAGGPATGASQGDVLASKRSDTRYSM